VAVVVVVFVVRTRWSIRKQKQGRSLAEFAT
jgi:hypothetical protein